MDVPENVLQPLPGSGPVDDHGASADDIEVERAAGFAMGLSTHATRARVGDGLYEGTDVLGRPGYWFRQSRFF